MRLHSLRLRAFGPFAAEQSIDFEPLGAGGLFLLDGPTGAGKSTVLDAITFALYGPGEGGGWGRLHSHFAEAGVEPEVCLEFSIRGVRQRVTRSPEYPRPKRRGEGTVVEKAQVHLERREGGRWVSRSSRKDEVGEILGDELGLSRDQFTQVVLLPQGEFMRFLRAGDDERRGLLTKLFGTQLYDRITEELDRRRQVAARALDTADNRLRARIGAAAEAAGLDAADHDALASLVPAEREARLADLERLLAESCDDAEAAGAHAALTLASTRAVADRAEADLDRMGRFVASTRAHRAHERTRDDYEQAAAVLEAAARAEPVRPLLQVCADADVAVDSALRALLDLVPDAEAGWRQGVGGDELAARATELARRCAALAHLADREQDLAEWTARVAAGRVRASAARGRVAVLTARERELPALLAAAAAARDDARVAVAQLDDLERRLDAIERRVTAAAQLDELHPRHVQLRAARERAFERYEVAVTRHLTLVEARLANMAAELASTLRDGEPCVVCGATEHPAPAGSRADGAGAEQVAEAERARRAAESDRDAVAADLGALETTSAALAATAALLPGETVEALHEQGLALRAQLDRAHDRAAALDEASAAHAELEVESSRLATDQRAAVSALATARAELEADERAEAELASELADAADGFPSVAARRRSLDTEAQVALAASERVGALAQALARRADARRHAAAEAAAVGFADLDAAQAAVVPRDQLGALRAVTAEWEGIAATLRGAVGVSEFDGLSVGDADHVAAQAASARQALDAAEAAARRAALTADRARRAVVRFATARAEVDTARAERDELDADAAPVTHLARLARGVAGHRRVNLTTYVLRQWFEQVVAAANLRLSGMSSGRYELLRVDEGASKTERTGLTLQVLDRHTGEQRSTRSLSGGETFYTSLALALGLADVVRAEAGGVDLDTLFIDEGFGSLDADTLDQVMAVIDELRDRGRTVGIVSHVHELKDRIAERIEVRRLPDGSSTLRVVA